MPVPETASGRTLERGLLTNAVGIVVKASRVIYLILFSRVLGAEGFGLYLLAFSIQEFISKFAILGLNWGTKQLVGDLTACRRPDRIRPTVQRILTVTLLASGTVGAGLYAGAGWVAGASGQGAIAPSLRIFACGFPFLCGMYVLVYSFRPRLDMRHELLVTSIVEPMAVLLIGSVLLWREPTIEAVARAHVAASVIAFGVALRLFAHLYRPVDAAESAPPLDWRRLFHGSASMGGIELAGNLQSRLDLLFLARLYPAEALGVYGAAIQVVSLLRKSRAAFDPILMPIAQNLYLNSDRERLQTQVSRAVAWATGVGLGLLGLMVLLREPLLGVFGHEFSGAGFGGVLVVLAFGQFFYMSLGLGEGILAITGHGYASLAGVVAVLAIEAVLLLLLTPRWGLTGAAVAASLPFAIVSVWRFLQSRRLLGITLFTSFHVRIVLVWLGCLAAALATVRVFDPATSSGIAVAAIGYLLLYGGLGSRMGFGRARTVSQA